MEKDVKDLLEWLTDKDADATIWSISDVFNEKDSPDWKTVEKIFTHEQHIVLAAILKKMLWALDEWHNKEDDEAHKDMRQELKKAEAHLRNHRHETTKNYSGKAEY